MKYLLALVVSVAAACPAIAENHLFSENTVSAAFAGRQGAFVVIDCSSGTLSDWRHPAGAKRLAPCSTFKIVNALIGRDTGLIKSADDAFYKWDGQIRAIAAWNRDLTLKQAFQASCVPAFRDLARRIGPGPMQFWIDKIGYGNADIAAGIDVFWLPAKDRRTILISPIEQARLMERLVAGTLPFSKASQDVVKELMFIKKTDHGALYGKTGSGADARGVFNLGWFVGYVETGATTYAFACTVEGENLMSKDAVAIVETVFQFSNKAAFP